MILSFKLYLRLKQIQIWLSDKKFFLNRSFEEELLELIMEFFG